MKVGSDVVVGGGGGVLDQVVQNADQKREEEKGEKLSIMSQYGTYYNYGVPILAILGATFGFLKGDWATRFITMGSTLAGRKVTWQITKRGEGASPWMRGRSGAQRNTAELRAREARARAQIGTENAMAIPVVSEQEMLV
jgi:hypothetical protein